MGTAAPLLFWLVLGCGGGAVTDPSRAGFEADPRIIEGQWATLITTAGETRRFDAELTPAGGVFLGQFDLFHNSKFVRLFFSNGTWDGTTLGFTALTPVGDRVIPFPWTARFVEAEGDQPDRLLLLSNLFRTPIEYVRPSALPMGFR
ncbi:MAG: hypothetical protein ACREMK_10085 [Gemmatimonadota bacterium]